MTSLAMHTLGACVLTGIMLTTTFAFSGYQGRDRNHESYEVPAFAQDYSRVPTFISTVELKEDKARFQLALSDKKQIAEVVMKQLMAFQNNDADTAYALASPLAQAGFKTPQQFLNGLSDMYGWFSMSKIKQLDGIDLNAPLPRQRLLLTSPTGREWIAYFTMEKQFDGAWKILGFMVQDAPGQIV